DDLRAIFPIRGFSLCFSNSCASSSVAVGEACRALKAGLFKAVLAGGFDVLTSLTIKGFNSLQIMSQEICRPLRGNSTGINLGEGGGLILLEDGSVQREYLGKICSYAGVNEAYHPVRPNPDGSRMFEVMETAMREARLSAEDICYVNAHGTGTQGNDEAEIAALKKMFPQRMIYHSTKGLHGHALSASGIIEGIISLIVLDDPVEWCKIFSLDIPDKRSCYALSNSFGFGGSNVSLIFKK
ncbi:MAG: beta-ketoacyl-[acyl-carrier-protein] synthase family protein, partial [Oligoflexales bacterium]|nr:beta-ketoacyl-[acyl-carrier-protein] synthase family protein [Oligoflexales bacterium]